MYVFKKIHDPANRYDISDVEFNVEDVGLPVTDLMTEFFRFLNASGYVIRDGSTIYIDDGGEVSIEHPKPPMSEKEDDCEDCSSCGDSDAKTPSSNNTEEELMEKISDYILTKTAELKKEMNTEEKKEIVEIDGLSFHRDFLEKHNPELLKNADYVDGHPLSIDALDDQTVKIGGINFKLSFLEKRVKDLMHMAVEESNLLNNPLTGLAKDIGGIPAPKTAKGLTPNYNYVHGLTPNYNSTVISQAAAEKMYDETSVLSGNYWLKGKGNE